MPHLSNAKKSKSMAQNLANASFFERKKEQMQKPSKCKRQQMQKPANV